MRPKHVLWLTVAVVFTVWYLTDPQATRAWPDSSAAQDRAAAQIANARQARPSLRPEL